MKYLSCDGGVEKLDLSRVIGPLEVNFEFLRVNTCILRPDQVAEIGPKLPKGTQVLVLDPQAVGGDGAAAVDLPAALHVDAAG